MKKVKKYIPIITIRIWKLFTLKEIHFSVRLSIIIHCVIALFRNLLFRKKYMKYFGYMFSYEGWQDPLTFLEYPIEINNTLLKQVNKSHIRKVLDIGGNIGQFAVTLSNLENPEVIDVIEPNTDIIGLLEENTNPYKKIRVFNLGIGPRGEQVFFYEKNGSAIGSIMKENAYRKIEDLKQIKVEFSDNISKITKIKNYDLIKIDVEGYEYEVIKNLKGITTKYLYIELSAYRKKSYIYSEIIKLITETFGDFELLFQDFVDKELNSFDILVAFRKKKKS